MLGKLPDLVRAVSYWEIYCKSSFNIIRLSTTFLFPRLSISPPLLAPIESCSYSAASQSIDVAFVKLARAVGEGEEEKVS